MATKPIKASGKRPAKKGRSTAKSSARRASAGSAQRVGGSLVGGNVVIGSGGEFVGRDKNVTQTSVDKSHSEFQIIYDRIASRPNTTPAERADIEAEVKDIEQEAKKGDKADETFLTRRLRSLGRMAPDILEVILATLGNPAAGLGLVASKVAQKVAKEAEGVKGMESGGRLARAALPGDSSGPMSEPEVAGLENSQVEGSSVGGDVDVRAGGHFVGRDMNVGLDVDKLVEALRRAFPSGDPTPERFGKLLETFRGYHALLHEWKELHNALNEIIDSFDTFAVQVRRTQAERAPLPPSMYRDAWRAVDRRVLELLRWAATVRQIGRAYRPSATGQPEQGEPWALEIRRQTDVIQNHLEEGMLLERFQAGGLTRILSGGPRQRWLTLLYDYSLEFDDVVKRNMSFADKQLRETATRLHELWSQAAATES